MITGEISHTIIFQPVYMKRNAMPLLTGLGEHKENKMKNQIREREKERNRRTERNREENQKDKVKEERERPRIITFSRNLPLRAVAKHAQRLSLHEQVMLQAQDTFHATSVISSADSLAACLLRAGRGSHYVIIYSSDKNKFPQ